MVSCPAPQTITSVNGLPTSVIYGTPFTANGTPPVTTTCTPTSGSVFPIGATTVTCTAVDAQQRTSTCEFLVTVNAPPTLALTRFVAFGDSITWGEDGTEGMTSNVFGFGKNRPAVQLPASQTYPGVLQQSLMARYTKQSPTVVNEGQPGEVVTDPGTRARFAIVMSGSRYDVVLLMEGSNDLSSLAQSTEPALSIGLQSVIASLHQMIRDATSRGVTPYLATIAPMNPNGFRGGAADLVPVFNDRVRGLARADGVTLVEVYDVLNTDIGTYIGFDGLHPTPAGYAKMADTFFVAIKQTLEQPAAVTATGAGRGRTSLSATPAATGQGSGFSRLPAR